MIYVSASPLDDKLFVDVGMEDDSGSENIANTSQNIDASFIFSGYFFILMTVGVLIIGVVILLVKRFNTTSSSPLLEIKQRDYLTIGMPLQNH